jgi:hypothetical protein
VIREHRPSTGLTRMLIPGDLQLTMLWSNLSGHLNRWKMHHLRSNT